MTPGTWVCRVGMAVALFGVAQTVHGQTAASTRVLVMPFENETREARAIWLGEACALLLADELSAMGLPAIDRRERREAFERLQVPPAAVLTDATVIRIGLLVGASDVVVGTFRLEDDRLTVRARSIGIDTGRLRQRVTQEGSLSELFALLERLGRGLEPSAARLAPDGARRRPDIGAFENYVKGLLADTPSTATAYLNAALATQPSFEPARLALWDVYTEHGEHRQAADEVVRVASDSPLAWRAKFLLGLSQLELGVAGDAFQTFSALAAIRRTPAVLNNLGVARLRGTDPGLSDEPTSYFGAAARADPSEPDFFFNLGYAYWLDKDARAAIYWLREAVRRDPGDGDAHFILGVALQQTGAATEATRERELAERLSSKYKGWEAKAGTGDPVPRGLERLHEELPYHATVETTDWKTLKDGSIRIEQTIYVERESQRRIFLGNGGDTIKRLSMEARADIVAMIEGPAHLFLFVKVRDNWGDDPERFREMPGVGVYVRAAVMSIAFGQPLASVDGNVKRVLARAFGVDEPVDRPEGTRSIQELADLLLDREQPGTFNQAVMELGALVCRPRNPDCPACPWSQDCIAHAEGSMDEYPHKSPRRVAPTARIAVGVVARRGRVLITRRAETAMLGGLWEFPGGKIRAGESAEHACRREIREETGLDVDVIERVARVRHAYTHLKVEIDVFRCTNRKGRVRLNGPVDHRWILLEETGQYAFPKANHKFMAVLKEQAGTPKRSGRRPRRGAKNNRRLDLSTNRD